MPGQCLDHSHRTCAHAPKHATGITVVSEVSLLGKCIPCQLTGVRCTDHGKIEQHERSGQDKPIQEKQGPATGNRTQVLWTDGAGKSPRDGNIDQGQEYTVDCQHPPVLQRQRKDQGEQQPCQAHRHHDLDSPGESALPQHPADEARCLGHAIKYQVPAK